MMLLKIFSQIRQDSELVLRKVIRRRIQPVQTILGLITSHLQLPSPRVCQSCDLQQTFQELHQTIQDMTMNRTSPSSSLTPTTRTPCVGVSAVSSKNSLKSSMQTFQITRMRSRENTRWWIRRFSGGRRCIQDQRDCEFCAAVAALR